MELKNSLIVGLLGKYADRFHEYQPARSIYENLKIAKDIPGVDGIEIVYPQDFEDYERTVEAIKDTGLAVSAVNLNVKSESKFKYGSFTNPDPTIRKEAITYLKKAMDLAADLGTEMVTCCPLIDGHDYNFQVDYRDQWNWLIEGLKEGASHRSDIKVSLEYKPYEARNNIILADMGRTLHVCDRVGLPNVGVTMDVGHALAAQENPAEMACLAAQTDRLFYVHFNDNNRAWDWDMLPGSVNLWDLVETLYYLDRMNWSGWLTYDVFTRHGDPAESFAVTNNIMKQAQELMYNIGPEVIQEYVNKGNPAQTFNFLFEQLASKTREDAKC
ncbi:sugar phosphate isomerase/epimerase family protein [Pontibacillus yanchengensis]|uniref:Xylose isomerase n=1 Tax=Pontibacillus yanchengensis Y32 TaxID=1385514 RepID=A0A0A2TYI4_9BACI|nr:sugar phosphate isomerase/epimerase family protein [Pontibacillus yanchengensis]KGP74300.1 xylose isomerase [Pontibacillus yanchengensis Y32]